MSIYLFFKDFINTSQTKKHQTLKEQEEELFKKPTSIWAKIRLYF